MIPRLGVNIDHVATLRQARGEKYPSLVDAAHAVLEAGADQITIHLREDRRHIQDFDVDAVRLVTKKFGKPLNFEMGCAEDIIEIAIETNPEWVCLVPEKREEKTTEGGLDLKSGATFNKIKETCEKLKKECKGLKISLFVEHSLEVLEKCAQLPIDAVEIHTGEYAKDFLEGEDINEHLEGYKKAHAYITSKNIAFHAGHGLTNKSWLPLLKQGLFEEYNIGHWIVSQALFEGLGNVVSKMKEDIK